MTKPFHVDAFKKNSRTSWLGSHFIYMNEVESTNSFLKKLPATELQHGTVLLTDYQTAGRGQYEKNWISDPCKNLTFTIGLKPDVSNSLTLLTLGCASAITEALQPYCSVSLMVKWPNDIMAVDKKLGGILTEAAFLGSKPERVLIGVGLNIDQANIEKNFSLKAESISNISIKRYTREKLLIECLNLIEVMYDRWLNSDTDLIKSIHSKLLGYGEWVRLQVYDKLLPEKYKFIGVNANGELLMLNEQLDVNKFTYEQVRIVPIKPAVQEV